MKKKWKDVPAGKLRVAEQRFWKGLGDAAGDVVTLFNEDPAFLADILRVARNFGFKYATPHDVALGIMSWPNFFSTHNEGNIYLGNFSQLDKLKLSKVPFSKATLDKCSKTHLLIPVPEVSLSRIQLENQYFEKDTKDGTFLFFEEDQHNDEKFNMLTCSMGWRLVRKIPLELSLGKTWQEQLDLCPPGEAVVDVPTLISIRASLLLSNHIERLFQGVRVRTNSKTSDGKVVCVEFAESGLVSLTTPDNDCRDPLLGVVTAVKPQSIW